MEQRESSEAAEPSRQANMEKRVGQVSALGWLMVGAVVIKESGNVPYMSEYGPGAGFFPFWLGVAVVLVSFGLLAEATFGQSAGEPLALPSGHSALQMLLVIAAFFAFVFLADKTGFLISVGLLFLFLLRVVEHRSWRHSLIVAVVSILALWAVFEFALKLRLPTGFLERLS